MLNAVLITLTALIHFYFIINTIPSMGCSYPIYVGLWYIQEYELGHAPICVYFLNCRLLSQKLCAAIECATFIIVSS